jgi:hypothetical protein
MRWHTSHGRTDLWSGEGRNFRAWLTSRSRNRRTKITRHMGLALLVAVIAVMLITVTPSCGMARWRTTPGACWQTGRHMLVARVKANMDATKGFPAATVRTDR